MPKQTDLQNILRKSGYKATPSRLAILEVFKKMRIPMSAKNIIDALPADTDQATVYRTLKSLKEKGIIKQIDLRHNHAHYELANTAEHHHLICLRCGRIEDVHHCNLEVTQEAVLKSSKKFAEIQQHALEFYGICKSCAKNQSS
jgi:Fur family ferric uptake transcriptional regulator